MVKPISSRVTQPTPEEVRAARKKAGLTQAEAAQVVSPAKVMPYRSWQSYEVAEGKPGCRAIPLAIWELFLLMTDQHPDLLVMQRKQEFKKETPQ